MRNEIPDYKERLKDIIINKSIRYSEKPFRLSSGKVSNYYFDCKKTTYDPEGIFLIGNIFFHIIQDLSIDAVGGLTLGADPIAFAISLASYQKGNPIRSFVVRKDSKEYGTKSMIEGNIKRGDKVIILDDVITTGSSTLKAVDIANKQGLNILKAGVLVDREEGGRINIENKGINLFSIFTKSELLINFE